MVATTDPPSCRLCAWEVGSGAELVSHAGHAGPIGGLALRPGGALAATGSHDGTVRVWDLGNLGPAWGLDCGPLGGKVGGLAFTPEGRYLIIGHGNGCISGTAHAVTRGGSGALVSPDCRPVRTCFDVPRRAGSQHRQRMLAVLQRQLDRALEPVRLVHGQDHLQRRPAVVHAAQRLAVLLDRLDQVLGDPHVARPQAGFLERLRLAEAGAGDLLPGDLALAGVHDGSSRNHTGGRLPVLICMMPRVP